LSFTGSPYEEGTERRYDRSTTFFYLEFHRKSLRRGN